MTDSTEKASGWTLLEPEEANALLAEMERHVAEHKAQELAKGKRELDEEQDRELIDQWWETAETCRSVEEASVFAARLRDDYYHDYGTICHATAAAGVAMANAIGLPAGITGFQAGIIGWELHRHFEQWDESPRRLLDLGNILYPQYDYKWLTIDQGTKDWLVTKAKERLDGADGLVSSEVRQRWELVASGQLPGFVRVEQ